MSRPEKKLTIITLIMLIVSKKLKNTLAVPTYSNVFKKQVVITFEDVFLAGIVTDFFFTQELREI